MRVYRDGLGVVWLVRDRQDKVRLEDLPPAKRTAILDELVHDAKGDEAASINDGGEDDHLAYLLGEDPRPQP